MASSPKTTVDMSSSTPLNAEDSNCRSESSDNHPSDCDPQPVTKAQTPDPSISSNSRPEDEEDPENSSNDSEDEEFDHDLHQGRGPREPVTVTVQGQPGATTVKK